MQALDLHIRIHGWVLQQVQDVATAWCYTIGLIESYQHPELVLMDVDPELQRGLMTQLVEGIATSGGLTNELLSRLGVRCVQVHQDHLRSDLFASWANRYGRFPQPGEILQVLLPDDAYCECHTSAQRRLDRPGPLPSGPRAPNRAERRRRARRGPGA